MSKFFVDTDEKELSEMQMDALCKALGNFVQADLPIGVEYLSVTEEEIRRLNRETRGIDKVTDVLSYPTLDDVKGKAIRGADFPYDIDEDGKLVIGSIVICKQRAKEQAEEYGHSYERELHYLFVHGVMHCLGYDHITEEERAEMREKEESVLKELGITRL
ncbi:MAG: rRNA maturation RNase YbeY [Clostridiales bacterium]|nr:rRNA maturation RNase YbeY [Clostridiales bacterium]